MKKTLNCEIYRKTKEEMTQTEIEGENLAENYLDRLKKGEFKTSKEMRKAILDNVVNTPYRRKSNLFIEAMWRKINQYENI